MNIKITVDVEVPEGLDLGAFEKKLTDFFFNEDGNADVFPEIEIVLDVAVEIKT